jgi:CheY-like chemotaxis protein
MTKQPIMIVEDEDILRGALAAWFRDEGYPVTEAEDGGKAIQILEGKRFSTIVVDLKMPGVDGLTVLREAKARYPRTHVIVITAYPTVQTAVEAMKDGALDYITKPFEPEHLEKVIENAMGIAERAPGPSQESILADAAREIFQGHLDKGKILYHQGKYGESLAQLEEALKINPQHFEARYLVGRVKELLEKQVVKAPAKAKTTQAKVAEPAGEQAAKECVWMKAKVVAYRMCYNEYQCAACEFGQMMQETKRTGKEDPKVAQMLEGLKSLPAGERQCRYMLSGKVSFRTCNKLFDCQRCEFDQMNQDVVAKPMK